MYSVSELLAWLVSGVAPLLAAHTVRNLVCALRGRPEPHPVTGPIRWWYYPLFAGGLVVSWDYIRDERGLPYPIMGVALAVVLLAGAADYLIQRRAQRTESAAAQDRIAARKAADAPHLVGQRELIAALSALLFAADPMGIAFPEDRNFNEYDVEAESITARRADIHSAADAQRVVYETLGWWFDPCDIGRPEDYQALAEDVWAVLKAHR